MSDRLEGDHAGSLARRPARATQIAAVTQIAEIAAFEPYGDAGKSKVAFRALARELPRAIPFGDAPPGSMQGARYTTKTALDGAQSVRDLLR